MRQPAAFALPTGGAIDRSRAARFTFDGTRYEGYAGDTLASALLANGVHLVGAQLQVPPSARHLQRRRRGAERARAARARRAHRAQCARDAGRAVRRARRAKPELLAVAALRHRCASPLRCRRCCRRASITRRSCGRPHAGWRDLRAAHPSRGRHGARAAASPIPIATSMSTRIATCWSSAAGRPACAAALAAGARGARVIVCHERPQFGGKPAVPATRRSTAARRRLGRRSAWPSLQRMPDVTLLPRTHGVRLLRRQSRRRCRARDGSPGMPPPDSRASGCGMCARRRSCSRAARSSGHRLCEQRPARA